MAHFRAVIQGQRGIASRLGSKSSGIEAEVNGWNGGVRVTGGYTSDGDGFDIYATNGSGGGVSDGYIGFVRDGVFYPSKSVQEKVLASVGVSVVGR